MQEEVQALEKQVAQTQAVIEETKNKCTSAQKLKHETHARLSRAADILTALQQCSNDMEIVPENPAHSAPLPNISPTQSAPLSNAASTSSTKTKSAGGLASVRSAPAGTSIVPLSVRFGGGKGKSRKSVDCFTHFKPIAMDCVATENTTFPFSFGSQVDDYKSAQAETAGAHPKDICWFIQEPFELHNGQLLSLSSGLGSYNCSMSIMLFFIANFLKATNFDKEIRLYDEGLVEGIDGTLQFLPFLDTACPYRRKIENFCNVFCFCFARLLNMLKTGGSGCADMDTSTSKPTRSDCSRAGSDSVGDGVGSFRKRSRNEGSSTAVLTCSLAERPMVDTRDPELDTITLRCGVNEETLMADAVRYVVGARSVVSPLCLLVLSWPAPMCRLSSSLAPTAAQDVHELGYIERLIP